MKKKGKIKKHFSDKGYGFIDYGDERDIFFHISNVEQKDKDKIICGQEVTFVVGKGRNGKEEARELKIINKESILNSVNYKLPKDTREAINFNLNEVDNYALHLNKIAYFDRRAKSEKFLFYKTNKQKEILDVKPNFTKIKFEKISQRQKALFDDIGLEVKSFEFKTDWRLIVGLGHESVYETSIILHHIYGFPFLPGSAIKGMARNYVIMAIFEGEEEKALKDEGFVAVFGKQEQQGRVIFFDAFPKTKPYLDVDIMNPHYGNYYSDDKNKIMPADYHDPKPINFLTVKDTKFNVYLAVKKENNIEIKQTFKDNNKQKLENVFTGKKPLDIAIKYVQEAFQKQGIGAKTAVGYGYSK